MDACKTEGETDCSYGRPEGGVYPDVSSALVSRSQGQEAPVAIDSTSFFLTKGHELCPSFQGQEATKHKNIYIMKRTLS
jgi:hypothetical protein